MNEAHERDMRTAMVLADIIVCQDQIAADPTYEADRSARANEFRARELADAVAAHREARDVFRTVMQ